MFPFVKTGGLADVTGALPGALAKADVAVTTLLPGYPSVVAQLPERSASVGVADLFGGDARLVAARLAGASLLVLDAPHLFARDGNPYLGPDGRDWPDNALRFAALARVAADIGCGALTDLRPDVLHAHDWQAGLVPAYLRFAGGAAPPTVMTVHNLAFQGRFPRELLPTLGLPQSAYDVEGLEHFDAIGYLKAGLFYADRITTVSPTYAREIATPTGGMGLDGLLRTRAAEVVGILNGIDTDVWNPSTDASLPATYDAHRRKAHAKSTLALQRRFGLAADPNAFVIGIVSRLSSQKGLDLVLGSLPRVLAPGVQLVVVGAGDAALEAAFVAAAAADPERVGCFVGYDEALAHLVQAGSHTILVPSRFEPCGLTQLCALRYGAVPIVARVGGLADTVVDANEMALSRGLATGFVFAPESPAALVDAVVRAHRLYRTSPHAWRRTQRNGMSTDVSWRRPAARYAALYRSLTGSVTRGT